MSPADNAPDLAPVDAPEAHPATTAPPGPENAPKGQQEPDAGDVEPTAQELKRQAEQLDRIRWALIPHGIAVHTIRWEMQSRRGVGWLASSWGESRLFFTMSDLARWAARVEVDR